MRVAIELSGEQPTLARAEASTLLETLGGESTGALERVQLGTLPGEPSALAERLGLARRVVETVATCPVDVDEIASLADQVPLDGQRFAVRCSRLDPQLPRDLPVAVARSLGARLGERGLVDLEDPQVVVRVLLDREAVLGLERATVDRASFEARHVEERPFFSPVSLHPRLARALVNLAGVSPGDRVWDPFTGTGGLTLEAALVGANVVASDLDPGMVDGTRETLAAFGCQAELVEGDVEAVAAELGSVDAVVTDPPYGRASSTHREEARGLYARAFRAVASVLEPGGTLACILPNPEDARAAKGHLELIDRYAWYVHGSLTRYVHVFQPPA